MRVFEALGTIHTKCCATCKHWNQDSIKPQAGLCGFTTEVTQRRELPTLDLALCSKWEAKEYGE